MKRLILALWAALALPFAAQAQDTDAFVEANVLATLYHELGHALIDIEGLPVFGQEEDAADVLSVLLIHAFFEEDDAVAIAYDTAFGFLSEAQENAEDVAFWDVHGPDEQRYYTLVCLFYGANPDERHDVAEDLGLPAERAEYCEDEFLLADESWGLVLDDLAANAPGDSIKVGTLTQDDWVADLIKDEVRLLNQDYALSDALTVSYAPCGEPNAFYDPSALEITICTEYVRYLAQMAD